MRVGSLFAGIGGFDLGLERAGFEIAWQIEIDDYCQRVLAKHWPHVKRYGDIRTIDWGTVEPVDLLCGGFPCQDISLAGKGAGLAGERSGLWFEYAKAIEVLKPRYVLIENVSALRSRGLDQVLGSLAALGYDAEWHCIPACAVGAPHQRDRVWIVAYASCTGRRSRGQSSSTRQEIAHRSIEMADAEGARLERTRDVTGADRCGQETGFFGCGGEDVADADEERRDGRTGIVWTRRWGEFENGSRWQPEPDVGRVAYGVPKRVDRLRGLGNAIVPQIAEWLGRHIMKVHG